MLLNPESLNTDIRSRASEISWLVLDVDGVMTDGGLIRGDDGQEYKRFSARDGLGHRLFRDAGMHTAIITARESKVVEARAKELKITEVHQGKHDKKSVLLDLCKRQQIELRCVAYMGDDLVDHAAMRVAGLGLSVADANPATRQLANWVSQYPGGHGAVREAIEMLLFCQGKLDDVTGAITGDGVDPALR